MLYEISRYDLYYFLKLNFFDLKTCINSYYLVFNFYQINKNNKRFKFVIAWSSRLSYHVKELFYQKA